MSTPSNRSRANLHDRKTPQPPGYLRRKNPFIVGLTLYSSHFKTYFPISIRANLWLLIPIYGWAKHHLLNAAIARHAVYELQNQPELITESIERLRPQIWNLFAIQLLLSVVFSAINAIIYSGLSLVSTLGTESNINPSQLAVDSPIFIGLCALLSVPILWLSARLLLPEVVYAAGEDSDKNIIEAIGQSWKMMRNKVAWQTIPTLLILMLITTVTGLSVLSVATLIMLLIFRLPGANTIAYFLMFFLFFLSPLVVLGFPALVGIATSFVMPLWQTTKAAIYYNLSEQQGDRV